MNSGLSRIKKGDQVKVASGEDRGKIGKVEKMIPERDAALVSGARVAKRHLRASRQNPRGGIVDKLLPIHLSNLVLVCPNCHKPTKPKIQLLSGGKSRICRNCGRTIDLEREVKTKTSK